MSDGVCRPIVKTGQKLEFFHGKLLGWDAKLVTKLSNGGVFCAHDGAIGNILRFVDLWRFHSVERVRAARVCPYLEREKNHC